MYTILTSSPARSRAAVVLQQNVVFGGNFMPTLFFRVSERPDCTNLQKIHCQCFLGYIRTFCALFKFRRGFCVYLLSFVMYLLNIFVLKLFG